MDTNPFVSIIMSVTNRPLNLSNTLISWSRIDYPNFDFTVIDNGSGNPELERIVNSFKDRLPVTFYRDSFQVINRVWNKYGKPSKGSYIIFAMMDEIVSHKDIIQKMLATSSEARVSIFTYFMSLRETIAMENYPWKEDPTCIPKPFTDQTGAGLISHITGNHRSNWDYFGWFRDDDQGHLFIDQDVYLREVALGPKFHCRTPKDVYCLHQFHSGPGPASVTYGYKYKTEAQARLLEPAERDT